MSYERIERPAGGNRIRTLGAGVSSRGDGGAPGRLARELNADEQKMDVALMIIIVE
jgi:hypothetical protein